jgi:Ribosomal protein L4/L1 family
LPKRMLLGALRSALSAKLADQKITVIDEWALETHKTKALRGVLDKLNGEKSALLVNHGENRNLELASRNLERVKLVATNVLQPYDLLNHDQLFVSKEAVARLSQSLDPERAPVAAPEAVEAPEAKPKKAAAPKAAAKSAGKKEIAAKKTAKPKAKGKK